MGNTPIPVMKNERRKKLKDETREYIVPIRMTFTEKDKIKKRAEKTNKNITNDIISSNGIISIFNSFSSFNFIYNFL